MAIYTARGTKSGKASTSSLTLADVQLNKDASLVVALGYDDAQGHPTSVKWGNRSLKLRHSRNPSLDISMSIWCANGIRNAGTRDVVATWAGTVVEKAMVATMLEDVKKIDLRRGQNETVGTASPGTGLSAGLETPKDIVLCFFVSEGPSSDSAGTADIKDGGNWTAATLGQRAGTVGTPPVSNVTVQETYLELTSCAATEGRLQNATSRLWTNGLIAYKATGSYLIYYSKGKCDVCGDILWCTDEISPVGCNCPAGGSVLNPDGTGTAGSCTDQELIDAGKIEMDLPASDSLELVEA